MLHVKKSQYIISYQPVTSQKYCGKHSIKYIIKGEKFKLYLTPASCYTEWHWDSLFSFDSSI